MSPCSRLGGRGESDAHSFFSKENLWSHKLQVTIQPDFRSTWPGLWSQSRTAPIFFIIFIFLECQCSSSRKYIKSRKSFLVFCKRVLKGNSDIFFLMTPLLMLRGFPGRRTGGLEKKRNAVITSSAGDLSCQSQVVSFSSRPSLASFC